MDPKTIKILEEKIEAAIADIIVVKMGLKAQSRARVTAASRRGTRVGTRRHSANQVSA